jgi:hypothetical protein
MWTVIDRARIPDFSGVRDFSDTKLQKLFDGSGSLP